MVARLIRPWESGSTVAIAGTDSATTTTRRHGDAHRESLLTQENAATIYKLSFTNLPHYNSIIEEVKGLFSSEIELINSRIEYAGSVNYGTLFIKVQANEQNNSAIENHFTAQTFNIKKVGYVGNSN
jgi:ABC-type methionine transport system ATPase subunit